MFVDLTPYMNTTPYTVFDSAPVCRAFKLFRTMGLRHLLVIDQHASIVGTLTRTDLTRDNCKETLKHMFDPHAANTATDMHNSPFRLNFALFSHLASTFFVHSYVRNLDASPRNSHSNRNAPSRRSAVADSAIRQALLTSF
jgi:hypothetical protein